jgi:hypothetical protein
MNQTRIIYHIARADFLERVRRYSFLVMLGAVVFLGYQAAIGNFTIQLGDYRGEFNSAWVGSMMALIASFMLGWFGFYLIKGSVTHDRETGVGQIMATTPLTRPLYSLGKWLSNFVVLVAMVVVLVMVGVALQYFAGESIQFDLLVFLSPFFFIALPMLALTAAFAVLFEYVGFLRGGFGNIVYFFFFGFVITLAISLGKNYPIFDPIGFRVLSNSMGEAAKAIFPDYSGSFSLGSTGAPIMGTFPWAGVDWTFGIIATRLMFLGIGIMMAFVSSLFFDRFDSSYRKPMRMTAQRTASFPKPKTVSSSHALSQPIHLTPLPTRTNSFTFIRVMTSELKLLLKGQPWWWYVIAGGLFIASLITPSESVRAYVLPIAWLCPVLIWSGLGNREFRHNTNQLVFSSAAPLTRQLPATWLAGFFITALTGGGAAIKFLGAGDTASLIVWLSAALFIPSLALALGVWSNSSKLFEVTYISMWYLAMNRLDAVDFFGVNSNGNVVFFIPLSIALSVFAYIGRARQI